MPESATADRRKADWWKSSWVLDRTRVVQLAWALGTVVAVGVLVGFVLYRIDASNPIVRFDERIADWFVARRTNRRNDLATWGAGLADTPIKIAISVVAVCLALWRWRRWREASLIAVSLTFEATAFIVTSFIVGRERPDVERLLDSPVDTSFPSGHVAAATVYGAFVIIVFWHTRNALARGAAVMSLIGVVAAVSTARMYQGMHYFTDVVGGIVLGVVSLVLCARIIGRPEDTDELAA